jgi:outer membrane protein OmpA-like peptidoglycan-associated protein
VNALHTLSALVVFAGTAGCAASIPPPELVNAHAVYERASHGPTAQVDPTDLHTAKESLDLAQQSFDRDGDTLDTRDLGYTAERRTEAAEARARAMMAATQKDQVVAQVATAELGRANQELAAQGAQLQSEVARRQAAEKRAAQASADLARIGSVKQETRGMVLTLSGSVLFTSGSSTLLPAAQVKLNDVADALVKQDPDSKIVVEGYTDSQGMASANQDLSQRRAQAVRDYLVSRGIAGDRVTAQGFGPSKPVADNASAEGRADNRRVEIVVQPTH